MRESNIVEFLTLNRKNSDEMQSQKTEKSDLNDEGSSKKINNSTESSPKNINIVENYNNSD